MAVCFWDKFLRAGRMLQVQMRKEMIELEKKQENFGRHGIARQSLRDTEISTETTFNEAAGFQDSWPFHRVNKRYMIG